MAKMALVLGGGAPNCTLMTGAMLAFDEAGVKFDVYSGAGGGGVMALTYLAPKGMSRRDALYNSINLSVSDAIFGVLPLNYKVFQKSGVMATAYRKLLSRLPGYKAVMNQLGMSKRERFLSDLIQLAWAITTPTWINFFDGGLCAHEPIINDVVDYDALKVISEELYLNAYSVEDKRMVTFGNAEINPRTLAASLGYPFIYETVEIGGKCYMEGGAVDAYNFTGLLETDEDIRTIVVLDAFGNLNYIRRPRNLFQGYCQQLILPLVEVCRKDLQLFEHYHLPKWNQEHPTKNVEMIRIKYDIPEKLMPTALDWSTSNMEQMFDIGYKAGKKHIKQHGIELGRTIPRHHHHNQVEA